MREVPVPAIGAKDVLVRVKAAAICGSDVLLYRSSPSLMAICRPPLTLGHEACGEVVAVGAGVTRLKEGDLVAMDSHISCGVCYQCQTGGAHVCENGVIFGVQTDGAFAEYARVPEVIAWAVLPVFGELNRESVKGAPVDPFPEALHDHLGPQLHRLEPHQRGWVDQAPCLSRRGCLPEGWSGPAGHFPPPSLTALTRRSTTSSAETPSASAL